MTGSYRTPLWLLLIVLLQLAIGQPSSAVLHHIPPEKVVLEEDLQIAAGLLLDLAVADVTLFYRTAGDQTYHEQPMEYRGGVWSAMVPAERLSEAGLEYLIVMRTLDGGYYASPDLTPFELPHQIPVVRKGSLGRRFPGPEKVASLQAVEADILILSPLEDEVLAPKDVVVALSLFNALNIDTATIKILIDDTDYTSEALITSEIISLTPPELSPGLHTVDVRMNNIYGMPVEPVLWSFRTSEGYIDLEERLTYSGDITTRLSSDRIQTEVLRVAEVTTKAEAGVSWLKTSTGLRLTSRESRFAQPMNRYSLEARVGDYLKINTGDFFPLLNPFVWDGKRVRGIGVDVNLRWLHFQLVTGNLVRAVQQDGMVDGGLYLKEADQDSTGRITYFLDRTGYDFQRKISAYRLTFDILSRYRFGLSLLRSRDVIPSVDQNISGARFTVDSTNSGGFGQLNQQVYGYNEFLSAVSGSGGLVNLDSKDWGGNSPEENLVAGLEYASVHDDQRLKIDANWMISFRNRDIWDGTMSRAEMDTALDDSLDGFVGVQYDDAGLVVGDPPMIDTTKIPDPLKYANLFTININMVPILPYDYLSYQDRPIRTLMNMPATAYNLRVRGYYFYNNISAEFRQVGPEYLSFGNPYLSGNIREFILADRIMMLDNKLMVNASFKSQSNQILTTTVNPYKTRTVLATVTLAPGPEVPSLTMNFQSITKNNSGDDSDSLSTTSDLRESTLTRNSVLSINFPFNMGAIKSNLVINRYQISTSDLLEQDRQNNQALIPETESGSTALSLVSHFPEWRFKSTVNFNSTALTTSDAEYTWKQIGVRGQYSLREDRGNLSAAVNYLASTGYTLNEVYNSQVSLDWRLYDNLVATGLFQFQFSHTPSYKSDGEDNDDDGKVDEYFETYDLNSSTINIVLNYKF